MPPVELPPGTSTLSAWLYPGYRVVTPGAADDAEAVATRMAISAITWARDPYCSPIGIPRQDPLKKRSTLPPY